MKKIAGLLVVFATVIAAVWAVPALAGGVMIDTDGVATVAQDTTVDGAAFIAGDRVEIDGVVKGDVFCAGGDISIRGTVEGDVLCAGNTLTVSGTVKGDIRLAGNVVLVDGIVDGAVTAGAANFTLHQDAQIGTDLVVGADSVTINGTVNRDLKSGSSSLVIAGTIGRDVNAGVERLSVVSGARVGGDLNYTSTRQGAISEGVVAGKTTQQRQTERGGALNAEQAAVALLLGALASIIFMTALTLFIVLIAPRYVRMATKVDWKGLLFATLVGILASAVFLPLVLLSFMSIIGLLIGVLLIVAFGLISLLATPLVAYYIGRWVLEGRSKNMLLAALVGSALVGIATIIPLIGLLFSLAVYFTGVGLVILSFRTQYQEGYESAVTPPAAPPVIEVADATNTSLPQSSRKKPVKKSVKK